jgi:rod shape-determining protein MreC
MQQLVSFIEKHKFVLLFILLEILAFLFTIQSKSYHKSQFINSANSITGGLFKNYNSFFSFTSLKSENDRLHLENTLLRNALDVKSNEVLSIQRDSTSQKYTYIAAKIIRNSYAHRNNVLTIDKGSKDGLTIDMGVVNSESIIGIVNNVSENYATVLSILNEKCNINARLKNSSYFGSLGWDGKNHKIAQLYDIQRQAPLKIGDTIVSGSRSMLFPDGIEIGTVSSFEAGNKKYKNIQIRLATDMSNLGHIYVVKNRYKNEIKQLENNND